MYVLYVSVLLYGRPGGGLEAVLVVLVEGFDTRRHAVFIVAEVHELRDAHRECGAGEAALHAQGVARLAVEGRVVLNEVVVFDEVGAPVAVGSGADRVLHVPGHVRVVDVPDVNLCMWEGEVQIHCERCKASTLPKECRRALATGLLRASSTAVWI